MSECVVFHLNYKEQSAICLLCALLSRNLNANKLNKTLKQNTNSTRQWMIVKLHAALTQCYTFDRIFWFNSFFQKKKFADNSLAGGLLLFLKHRCFLQFSKALKLFHFPRNSEFVTKIYCFQFGTIVVIFSVLISYSTLFYSKNSRLCDFVFSCRSPLHHAWWDTHMFHMFYVREININHCVGREILIHQFFLLVTFIVWSFYFFRSFIFICALNSLLIRSNRMHLYTI